MAVDPDLFKQSLRRWASGVTVVTAKSPSDQHGMTVSAFSSVSAEPPLVLICANRNSKTNGVIKEGGQFAVNILASDQQDVSNTFASSKTEATRFETTPWRKGDATDLPLIEGALANLECKVVEAIDQGSHTIYIGHVEAAHVADKAPLLYFDGGYREVAKGE